MFDDDYFENRNRTDKRRIKSFASERAFLQKFLDLSSPVLDFGCSTGEFLAEINWPGERWGIEVNLSAATKAKENGLKIIDEQDCSQGQFDVVILRGVIQHLKDPFNFLSKAHSWLTPGGHLVFLATPNAESIVYRMFGELPALDQPRNYWVPGQRELISYCEREGFAYVASRRPYLSSGYAKLSDFLKFGLRCLGFPMKVNFAFPGNMFDLVLERRP